MYSNRKSEVLRDVNDIDVSTTVAYNVIYIFGL